MIIERSSGCGKKSATIVNYRLWKIARKIAALPDDRSSLVPVYRKTEYKKCYT